MYMIVVGGGKVGFYLARELLSEGHEVLIIERDQKDPHRSEQIADELGSEVVLRGDGCEASTLDEAGAARADMLIAVTGEDEDNLVACQVAKNRFQIPRTIARINNPKNEVIFKRLGIDTTVSGTTAILARIEEEVPTHRFIPLLTLRGSGLELMEVRIPEESPVAGRPLAEVALPQGALIVLIVDANGNVASPTPDATVHGGDEVVAVTRPEYAANLREVLTGSAAEALGAV
jgi:trk system potassium uptake protein